MIEKVLVFIIFLCPLIFFHELGHFLFARIFGVRVETFSIGFGPKLLKFKRGGTEYSFSLIPFGGYVKMFGDDPYGRDEIPESDRKYAFNHQGKWARFWIVFGGPLANFIFAYIIFFGLIFSGEKVPEGKFGSLSHDSIFYTSGVRTGDKLVEVNGQKIISVNEIDLSDNDKINSIKIARKSEEIKIPLNLTFKNFMQEYYQFLPYFRRPLLINTRGSLFVITENEGQVNWKESLEVLENKENKNLFLYQVSNVDLNEDLSEQKLSVDYSNQYKIERIDNKQESFYQNIAKKGHYPLDLRISKVVPDSPASKAGLKLGDILISINGKKIYSFTDLRDILQKIPEERAVLIQYYRNTTLNTVKIHPEVVGEGEQKILRIGVYSTQTHLPLIFVMTEGKSFFGSIGPSFSRTWDCAVRMVIGLKQLVTNKSSLKNIGGPLAISKLASDSLSVGISAFFKIMALISVNLGIVNLFPIPVLDGGHIMFIILEIINRGPVSRRTLELAHQFGFSLLLLLIFVTLFNDITRLVK